MSLCVARELVSLAEDSLSEERSLLKLVKRSIATFEALAFAQRPL